MLSSQAHNSKKQDEESKVDSQDQETFERAEVVIKSENMRYLLEKCKVHEYRWDMSEFRFCEMRVRGDYGYL